MTLQHVSEWCQMSPVLVHKCPQTQEKGASVCCETLKTLHGHLTEKPWSNMWTEFKGGWKAGRVCEEGPNWYGSWELGGGRMAAPSYTPSVGNLRVLVPGEKLCCLVTFCSSGFTSSVRPLRSRHRSEKKRLIPVTLQLLHQRLCSFPSSCIMPSKLK